MFVFLAALVPSILAQGYVGHNVPRPGNYPPLFPPNIEMLIPGDILAKMKMIHADPNLPPQKKHEEIDDLMVALPADVLDKIPPPPGFERLPRDVQDEFKRISRNRNMPWVERQAAIRRYIESLPADVKALIPMPGGAGGPPSFEAIPPQTRAAIQMVEQDTRLSFRERYNKIKEIMDSLPAEIRAKLPAAPPPPPF